MNGSKAPPDLLVHPSNKQKHRSYCYQFADYCIYEYSVKAFVFNVLSVVHPKTGAPLPKKCTVHQREGCTSEAEHPDGSVSEKQKCRMPNYQGPQRFRTVNFSWTS